jgi:hypothetical protein
VDDAIEAAIKRRRFHIGVLSTEDVVTAAELSQFASTAQNI